MRSRWRLAIWFCALGPALLFGQGSAERTPPLPPPSPNAPPPSLQAPADPGYATLIATCKTPPPARGGGPGRAGGRGPAPVAGPRDYTITEIPGVIAARQRWTFVWQEAGNNGDGIVGTTDGGVLIAQNDNSTVVKLDKNGKPSVVYADTHTGGSLSISKKGDVFIVQRGLKSGILQLAPRRRQLATSYQGDPLDCVGGNPNDLSADSKGGVYFTQGGVYYADPMGTITRYGENITPNGIVLSADETTLYVTNGPTLAAFDVRADGSLASQREFAKLQGGGNGDGSTIDAAGRIYVTTNPGVQVIGPDGTYLGIIPTPRPVISAAFAGADKKTLYVLARGATTAAGEEVANAAQVYSIQMIAQGYKGRAK
ncbi:MAG TPA: SMP-30/gluconolactonase/LRE family protein [Vicinamibacterales bacterium]|jgi:gluconolactonase|nr:SMP-30/gluconolactonase/LRE family protein [Vicinamibacterales bacterium]